MGLFSKDDKTSAALMRQSLAQLRKRNAEQRAILIAEYRRLQQNVSAAGGAVLNQHEEADSFDFWEAETDQPPDDLFAAADNDDEDFSFG